MTCRMHIVLPVQPRSNRDSRRLPEQGFQVRSGLTRFDLIALASTVPVDRIAISFHTERPAPGTKCFLLPPRLLTAVLLHDQCDLCDCVSK